MGRRALGLIFLLFLFSCDNRDVIINGVPIKAEVVNSPEERAHGLMFREELCDDCGMLFVFEATDLHSFWMRNTILPLDIIHISEKMTVVDILNAVPCETEDCPSYVPRHKSKYVLEVNSGFSSANGISLGNQVEFPPSIKIVES